jgi:erythromycin esterase-like protein
MEAVLAYLDQADPEAARRARSRYACFDHFQEDSQAYGYAASYGIGQDCMDQVVQQLVELRSREASLTRNDGERASEAFFAAEQNARLVKSAEEYYRSMFRGRASSWNLRDTHMVETLDALGAHLARRGEAKIVVWAHNSHLGDARATQMGQGGELNVGELVRERHGGDCFLLGFSTYSGTVTAASDWDAPPETKRVRPGLAGSYEALFHATGVPRFLLPIERASLPEEMRGPHLQRAIGVIYRPQTERESHYFEARLGEQFDALVHIDETRALEPLEPRATTASIEAPETYPTGR